MNPVIFKTKIADDGLGVWIVLKELETGVFQSIWLTKDQAHQLAMSLEGHCQGIQDAELAEDQDPAGVGPPRGVLREGGVGGADEPVQG